MALISQMDTGQEYHLPSEQPSEHEFPYVSPLDKLWDDDRQAEDVTDEASPKAKVHGKHGKAGRAEKKRVAWPPLSPGFEGIEVILLAGPLNEVLKKTKYAGIFHRAFVGALGTMPLFEEMGSVIDMDMPFRPKANSKVRQPPRKAAPERQGTMHHKSTIASVMAPGAEVIFETMKYQAHFEASTRLSFRHRTAQFGHLVGWELRDERHACPRMEDDMVEKRAQDLEKDATDFMRFAVAPAV